MFGSLGEESCGEMLELVIEGNHVWQSECVTPGWWGWLRLYRGWLGWGCAIEEAVGEVANASKGIDGEWKEGDAACENCVEVGGVVDIGGVRELPAQSKQVSLGYRVC